MKKIYFITLFLFLIVACSNSKYKADKLYKSCLLENCIIDYTESEKSLTKLNEAIKLNCKEWNYYFQKIIIYKYRLVNAKTIDEKNDNLNNIISIYNEWEQKNNEINSNMKFGLGCAYFSANQKKIGTKILNECYNEISENKIEILEEKNVIEGILAGIITTQITEDKLLYFLKNEKYKIYKDFFLQEIKEHTPDELAMKYVGGI